MGHVLDGDVSALAHDGLVDWDEIAGSHVVVTGATGLIGGIACRAILARNDAFDARIRLTCLVRDPARARARLGARPDIAYLPWDAEKGTCPETEPVDYVLHCAANTDSTLMVERPIETIVAIACGCQSMLALACAHGARMVYVSSMEVYGAGSDHVLTESEGGALDAMSVRSSYPQAKQLAETLCAAWASERGAKVSVARLAQTFGAGISPDDRRIFAEIARRCASGTDIVLATDGSKRNMYCYTAEAVQALLVLLTRGEAGLAYNVANEDTLCSVLEMARLAASRLSPTCAVITNADPEARRRYAVSGTIALDTTRMARLGWEPRVGLAEMYERMLADWRQDTPLA